ncbi:MAG: hypothetical protein VX768_11400, partial [Planctomycetota bacterium]|nr:hypothetical protein [Planctomycetota bacterium]
MSDSGFSGTNDYYRHQQSVPATPGASCRAAKGTRRRSGHGGIPQAFQSARRSGPREGRTSIPVIGIWCLIFAATLLIPSRDLCCQERGSDISSSADAVYELPLLPIRDADQQADTAVAGILHALMATSQRDSVKALRRLQRTWLTCRWQKQNSRKQDFPEERVPESGAQRRPSSVVFEQILQISEALQLTHEFLLYAEAGMDEPLADARIALRSAVALTDRKKYLAAATYYRKWLDLKKESTVNYLKVLIEIEMGRLWYLSGNYSQAESAFLLALEHLDSNRLPEKQKQQLLRNSEVTYRLMASTFLKTENTGLAEKTFALANRGKELPIHLLDAAQIAFAKKEYARSRDLCYRFIAKQPNHSEAYELLEKILKQPGSDDPLKKANFVTALEAIRKKHPSGKVLDDLLVKLYLQAGRIGKAKQILQNQRRDSLWRDRANR